MSSHVDTLVCHIINNVSETGMESKISANGQATIPKRVREHLGLKAGDRVKFFLHPDGGAVLLPKLKASALRGMLKSRLQRPVTIAEMSAAIAEAASGDTASTKRR